MLSGVNTLARHQRLPPVPSIALWPTVPNWPQAVTARPLPATGRILRKAALHTGKHRLTLNPARSPPRPRATRLFLASERILHGLTGVAAIRQALVELARHKFAFGEVDSAAGATHRIGSLVGQARITEYRRIRKHCRARVDIIVFKPYNSIIYYSQRLIA